MENKQMTIKDMSGEQLALALQERYQDIQRIQNEIQFINAELQSRLNSPKTENDEPE